MYVWKRGDLVVVVVLLLFVIVGSFFFIHNANITGAVVSVNVTEELAAIETTNQPVTDSVEILPVEEPQQQLEPLPEEDVYTAESSTTVTEEESLEANSESGLQLTALSPTVNIATCDTLGTANTYYDLTNNVSSVETCFNITASNITLDCHGFWINYSTGRAIGVGINITTADNITIRDCIINEAIANASASREALRVIGTSENSTLFNSTLLIGSSSSRTITLQNTRGWNLTNNTIYSKGTATAVIINNGQRTTLHLNNITMANTTGGGAAGITLTDQSLNNTFSFNLINTQRGGIYILDASNYTNVRSNTIIADIGTGVYGLYIFESSYENLTGNMINTTMSASVFIEGNLGEHFNHTIDYTNLVEGLAYVYNYSQFNKMMFNNTNLTNIYGGIACGWCSGVNYTNITLDSDGVSFFNVTNAKIDFSNISSSNNNPIYFTSSSGNLVLNSTIIPSASGTYGIYLSGGSNSSTLANNTISITTSTANVRGIRLESGSNNNLLIGNTINTTPSTGYGISITDSKLNQVRENIVFTRGGSASHAIFIGTSAHNTTVASNRVDTAATGATAIFVSLSNYTVIANNSVTTIDGAPMDISTSSFANLTYNSFNTTQGGGPVLVRGSTIDDFNQSIDVTNLASGLPLVYNFSQRHVVLFEHINLTNIYNTLLCGWCVNVTYRNITINGNGIILENVTASLVELSNISVSSGHAIFLHTSSGNTIKNNSLNVSNNVGSVSIFGVHLLSSDGNVIANNTFRLSINRAGAIDIVTSGNNNSIESNNVHGNAANANAVLFSSGVTASGTTIRNNNFTLINATSSNGIQSQTGTVSNTIVENNIIDTLTDSIFLGASTSGMYLINNNITSSSGLEINDRSGNDTINYLVYNSTFGEVKWINQSGGARFAFLDNLTITVSNDLGIGLSRNLFIGNNTFALNTSAFGSGTLINTSANISLFGLPFTNISNVRRVENFTTNSSNIRDAGMNCHPDTCFIIYYNATSGVALLNTSFFSSFTAFSDVPVFTRASNTSLNFRRFENVTVNITIDAVALDVYIFVSNISGTRTNLTTNTTRDISGSQYNASEPVNITLMKGTSACWYFWANSTTGESANSTQYCFTVQNTPAVFNETIGTRSIEYASLFTMKVNCTDGVDNDTITYYDNTSLFEINSTNGSIFDTPTSTEIGSYLINITCSDGEINASQLMTYTINDIPPPPSGGGSSGDEGSSTPPATPPAEPPAEPSEPETPTEEEDFYTPAETQQNILGSVGGIRIIREEVNESIILINETIEEKRKRTVEEVIVILENKGNKRMRLFPTIFQEFADPYFIVTRKTLGYSDSLFSKIASLAYSEKPVSGRLLAAEIVNPEQIILEPGQRLEKKLQIREGLANEKEFRIQFTTGGQVVFEEELPARKKIFSGSAIDPYPDENALDIYVFIAPPIPTEKLEEYYQTQTSETLTGAAVLDSAFKNVLREDEYLLEVNIIKKGAELPKNPSLIKEIKDSLFGKKTYFNDLYGPYKLKQEQIFIFAQQLEYNPKKYTGDYLVQTTIYKGNAVIVKNEFEATLG